MATPPLSCPMYLPAAPFALADVVTCAILVDIAYDQYLQWQHQNYPSRANFKWVPPKNGYAYSTPLTWPDNYGYHEPFGFFAVNTASRDAFLVFRGTMSTSDEEQDAKFFQTPYKFAPGYGQVHIGFHEIYHRLQAQIHAAVSALNKATPCKRLFFTGHSLGCGLSSLAVPDVIANVPINPGPVPFLHYILASPRVGDPDYAWKMDSNGVPTYRIVNTEDLVPDLPLPLAAGTVYKHIGTPVDFTAQYGTTDDNHSLDLAYDYAIHHPANPQGKVQVRAPGLAKRPGIRVVMDGKLTRLARPEPGTPA
jgi:triacylglycerol lipase